MKQEKKSVGFGPLHIRMDDESDGGLTWDERTKERYVELKNLPINADLAPFDIFVAFTDKQFEDGVKTLRPLRDGEKLVSFGAGMFGISTGVDRYFAFCEDTDRRIAAECDPQEVYCYEYNNYECMYACDGDTSAVRIVARLFGWDAVRHLKRFSAVYPVDELKK